MIHDYSVYELSRKEHGTFLLLGYACFFSAGFLFYRSILISGACGLLIRFCLPYYRGHLADRRMQQARRK